MKNSDNLTLFQAGLHQKCPRCRKGDMFVSSNYDLSRFSQMHSSCPNCGLHYQVEPGFFTGAMYFSYAVSVFVIVTITIALTVLLGNPPVWVYFTAILSVTILITPLNFRYSRVLMLYLFGGAHTKR